MNKNIYLPFICESILSGFWNVQRTVISPITFYGEKRSSVVCPEEFSYLVLWAGAKMNK